MKPTIKLNRTANTTVTFDVSIAGIVGEVLVRLFLVKDKQYDISIQGKESDGKWKVAIPKDLASEDVSSFYVEVILDGYNSRPFEGKVELFTPPTITMSEDEPEDREEHEEDDKKKTEDEEPKKQKKEIKEDFPTAIVLDVPIIKAEKSEVDNIIQNVLLGIVTKTS